MGEIKIQVPGKLIIAGEYAILETNQPGIVVGIDRYITARVVESDRYMFSQNQYAMNDLSFCLGKDGIVFGLNESKNSFIKDAMELAFSYLLSMGIDLRPFHISLDSSLDDTRTGLKYGLGSSAAVVVAMIAAILQWNLQIDIASNKMLLYKLAVLAHLKSQGNGSGIDIAAAVYGGWIYYVRYDGVWLHSLIDQGKSYKEIIEMDWIGLVIEPLPTPSNLTLGVGWTANPSKTGPMVRQMEEYKGLHQSEYEGFLNHSKMAVHKILFGLKSNQIDHIMEGLLESRQGLQYLEHKAKIEITTKELSLLCEVGDQFGVGKPSGAGGGDCGIVLLKQKEMLSSLWEAWNNSHITPLNISVEYRGVSQIQ